MFVNTKLKGYNILFPLKVWIATVFIGTALHVLSSKDLHLPATKYPFFVELLIAVNYSVFTLVVSYVIFYFLVRTLLRPVYIKVIVAITGCICCIATIMFKFNFSINEFGKDGYWSIILSFCLPLLITSLLIRLKEDMK